MPLRIEWEAALNREEKVRANECLWVIADAYVWLLGEEPLNTNTDRMGGHL
jgi:hypothetical protein